MFIDIFIVIARFRGRFFGILTVITLISLGVALLWPKTYMSTAKYVQYDSSVSGSLGGLISSFTNLPSGGEKVNTEQSAIILRSRTMLDTVIEEFDLAAVYEKEIQEELRLKLEENTIIEEIREAGIGFNPIVSVSVSVLDRDPQRAKEMVEFYLEELDDRMVEINQRNAQRMLTAYEARYQQNLTDLETATQELVDFQKTYGILEPQTQTAALIGNAAQVKAQMTALDVEIGVAQSLLSASSGELTELLERKRQLEKTYNSLIVDPVSINGTPNEVFTDATLDVFPALEDMPTLAAEYLRLFREATVQQEIYKVLLPQYEQQKMMVMESNSGLELIDQPNLPTYKEKPKRAFIVIAGFFFGLFAAFFSVSFADFIRKGKQGEQSEAYQKYQELMSVFQKS
jgi:capsule polysaccharide export protein KpsE/RkpR